MSASVADILRGAGFAPIVPTASPPTGDAETQAGSRVPTAPIVPARRHKAAIETSNANAIRARLLELAAAAYMDAAPVRALSESFLRDCDGMADGALRALLSMLSDDADRRAGRVPTGDTAAALCQHCGPVYLHPSIAAVLPVVGGWPRALGCPWCFIRKAGLYVPRPPVECATCHHFVRDTVNLAQGLGSCGIGARRGIDPPTYPFTTRHCGSWRPLEEGT